MFSAPVAAAGSATVGQAGQHTCHTPPCIRPTWRTQLRQLQPFTACRSRVGASGRSALQVRVYHAQPQRGLHRLQRVACVILHRSGQAGCLISSGHRIDCTADADPHML